MSRSGADPALLACAAALLAGCAGGPSGRWIGQVVPDAGSAAAPGCRGPGKGVLTVGNGKVVFTPDDGVAVLTGQMEQDGRYRASRTTTGADKKPYVLIFDGHAEGDGVVGVYAAPRCRAMVTLRPD